MGNLLSTVSGYEPREMAQDLRRLHAYEERFEAASGPRTGWWTAIKSWFYPGRPRLLEGEYENMDDISRDEVPVPLTDALTTAFGGNAQIGGERPTEARSSYTKRYKLPPIERFILHREEYSRHLRTLVRMVEVIEEEGRWGDAGLPANLQEELKRQVDSVYRLYPAPPYTEEQYAQLSGSYKGLSLIIERLDHLSGQTAAGLRQRAAVLAQLKVKTSSRPVSQLDVVQEEGKEDDGINAAVGAAVDAAVESALDAAVGDDEGAREMAKNLIFLD